MTHLTLLLPYFSRQTTTGASKWLTGPLGMTAIAESLLLAAIGYRLGHAPGRAIFVFGIVSAGGLMALAATACSELPDSVRSHLPGATATTSSVQSESGEGAANIQKMIREYEAHRLRAKPLYENKTILVGGEITSFEQHIVGGSRSITPRDDPNKGTLPRVWLKSRVSLTFASNDSLDWLIAKNAGDQIEAECRVFSLQPGTIGHGLLRLDKCERVPEG